MPRSINVSTENSRTCTSGLAINEVVCDDSVAVNNAAFYNSGMELLSRTLLKVVPVVVSGPAGDAEVYALLDDGSSATLIDADVAQSIGITGPNDTIRMEGVGGMSRTAAVKLVDFKIRGRHSDEQFLVQRARSIHSLSLSAQSVSSREIKRYCHLTELADFLTLKDASPSVLIGADQWHLSVSRSVRYGNRSQPVAALTALGWVLYGVVCNKSKPIEFVNSNIVNSCIEQCTDTSIENLIKEQYRLDSIGISTKKKYSSLEERALQILECTARRLESGRFEAGLLWRDDLAFIPDSYPQALSRFKTLEKKMLADSSYADLYRQNIEALFEKDYAEECESVSNGNSSNRIWYLPHFGVTHWQKPGKLRVVHDAAAKTAGVSLNNMLLSGPDLLQSLLGILFRFREGRIALLADIKDMFPRVKVREQDRDMQRFLWRRDGPNCPIREYRMSSLIFGAACSPCIALFIKNKNALEYKERFPAAYNAIVNDHYMDDFLGSVNDLDEAARLASDIVTVHKFAGFEMRGWVSNIPESLVLLPSHLLRDPPEHVNISSGPIYVRTLGVIWFPSDDFISFRSGLPETLPTVLTKRIVLSFLMSVYDPQGLIMPLVIKGRILFQQLWRSGVGWDVNLVPPVSSSWQEWFQELSLVTRVRIPRWYLSDMQPISRQIHVFADASEQAYACVAYWRFVYSDGRVNLSLIGSKARVSPLRPQSIPRLELQAALIAARFAHTIVKEHKMKATKMFYWTDSTTVLGWLKNDARSFKPFVSHRVGEITELSNIEDWRWTPSSSNVADDATRMGSNFNFQESRWLLGPSFLLQPACQWPTTHILNESLQDSYFAELKCDTRDLINVNVIRNSSPFVTPDPSTFSSWLRLLRATARVHQFARILLDRIPSRRNLRINPNTSFSMGTFPSPLTVGPQTTTSTHPARTRGSRRGHVASFRPALIPLSAENLRIAELHLLRRSQLESFPDEIQCLLHSKTLPRDSRLRNLSAALDINGLLRLVGRIKAVEGVDEETRKPFLLDGRHLITKLLTMWYHCKAAHGNTELVLNEMRKKFWVLRLRNTVKEASRTCQFCRLRRATPSIPPTGDLPSERLGHHLRPFTYSGLDYFGPVTVSVGRRQEKRYVALYTCMTVRAVHLEVVTNLSTDAAIMSLRRFIARRGAPSKILSDNATCFVGAANELASLFGPDLLNFAADKGIDWSFIPPASPFMGGCWERLVRSVKTAMRVTLRERAPRDEVLHTFLLEAEALINSRPITHVSLEEGEEALTPFHFIIGSSSNDPIHVELDEGDLVRRCNWRKSLRLADHFWERWVKEYLPTLQPRVSALSSPQKPIAVGDVVLIVDGNLPRGTWPRGRVSGLHPGQDGIVRVVDVTTRAGVLRRPTRKLVLLPTNRPETT